ncbi:MAG: HAD family hydrolase [Clostridia bacterium]|nr:HAD family hydrolase [Clostridia bacterium]
MKVVLFDLDGTLLPMDQDVFTKAYFSALAKKLMPHGYEANALIDAIWQGTAAMVKNNGDENNEAVFWKSFSQIFGEKVYGDKKYFEEFYEVDFQKIEKVCGHNPKAVTTVKRIKDMGFSVALATNPIFPAIATESRARWAGLDMNDFELYTTYENIGFCKPNPQYYLEIIKRLGVKPEECLMVGNDVKEDMVAKTIGMDVFLLTDCIINKNAEDISVYPNGDFDSLIEYIKAL